MQAERGYSIGQSKTTTTKSKYVCEVTLAEFLRRNAGHVYFWTFSEPGRGPGESLWTKDEAERALKPFRDLCARRGIQLVFVWEMQKRGSWHPHCLVNRYLDVLWLRSWMVQRGWGPQMRVERVWNPACSGNGIESSRGWIPARRVLLYLTKYLLKGREPAFSKFKKLFGGSKVAKAGTTKFQWCPWEKSGSYLWNAGRGLFLDLYGRPPAWRDMMHTIRLGVENTGWADYDFLWEFGFVNSS